MANIQPFEDVIAEIASRLELRDPNREAVQALAAKVSQYYDVDEKQPPFEAVIDSATGVGKTYILAGAIEFFAAAYGVSNFVIITPGRTILEKTQDNFTAGHPKSLLGRMSFQPAVITAENFDTPAMRAAMDDHCQVKVYLFTVQSLIQPESKVGRKTHKFQEGLGTKFYTHLKATDQLVVFADEHHCYYSPAFSRAVRDLDPWVLAGLTATPHKQTPREQIIFRYPLAAAIADKLVKTPVIVGRKDDRSDAETKLADGVTLLQAKDQAIGAYMKAMRVEPVTAVMLVVAKSIQDADEYAAILRSDEFFHGTYADAVLVVHSSAPDKALAELAKVEDLHSPVRVIISVGMLKEGWDVRNVYVIASMRPSVSEILTEQTLGRGMRLPFGRYTDIEILDTLEVIAHERYQELLKKIGVLNEAFVDHRTRVALRGNAKGQQRAVTENLTISAGPVFSDGESRLGSVRADGASSPVLTTTEQRTVNARTAVTALKQEVGRRPGMPPVRIPVLKMSNVQSNFSLADITGTDVFRKLGASLAADPDTELSRTMVSARVVIGADGVKRTELVTAEAADRIRSALRLQPEEDLREELAEAVLASPSVPARKCERTALEPLLNAFFEGLGSKAVAVMSANFGRVAARLVKLVEQEQRMYMAKPSYEEIVEIREFNPPRVTDKPLSPDRYGAFGKSVSYDDWQRGMYGLTWFDSRPERTVANMVDSDQHVTCWARLHIGDIPILWNSGGRQYNPDLLVIEADGTHWLVEVKADKDMDTAEVQAKREAARRWANHVSSKLDVKVSWRYLLVSESDIDTAKDSWEALKRLGQ
jgi:type III restriction enzyme